MKYQTLFTALLFAVPVTTATAQARGAGPGTKAAEPSPVAVPAPAPAPAPALAAREPGGFDDLLFPPDLVMQYQRQLELSAEQRGAITRAVQQLQNRVLEVQWDMQSAAQALREQLEANPIDQAKALAQVDQVLDLERQVKKAHLTALIQIKNTLSKSQQAMLLKLRMDGR